MLIFCKLAYDDDNDDRVFLLSYFIFLFLQKKSQRTLEAIALDYYYCGPFINAYYYYEMLTCWCVCFYFIIL